MAAFERLLAFLALSMTLLLCMPRGALAQGEQCTNYDLSEHVVEVSRDGVSRLGSGVLVTFDGYAVTAAHILTQNISPPLPLRLKVRVFDDEEAEWIDASIVRLYEEIDLAILKLDQIPGVEHATIRSGRTGLAPGSSVCILGFGIHRNGQDPAIFEDLKSVPSHISTYQIGYIVTDAPFISGFSGGGLFQDGELVGINLRRKSAGGSYSIPVSYLIDHAAGLGLYIDDQGRLVAGTAPRDLQLRLRETEKTLVRQEETLRRILRSIDWQIDLNFESLHNVEMILEADPAFPDQIVDGWFNIVVEFHFSDENFLNYMDDGNPLIDFVVTEKIVGQKMVIQGLEEELERVIAQYLPYDIDLQDKLPTRAVISPVILFQGWQRTLQQKEFQFD